LRAYAKKNAKKLGFRPDLFISVPSFHPTFRIAPDGRLSIDMVVEMSQKYDAPLDAKRPELGSFPMRGGATLLIAKPPLQNGASGTGELRYLIDRPLDRPNETQREDQQRHFFRRDSSVLESTDPQRFQLDFNMLHGGI